MVFQSYALYPHLTGEPTLRLRPERRVPDDEINRPVREVAPNSSASPPYPQADEALRRPAGMRPQAGRCSSSTSRSRPQREKLRVQIARHRPAGPRVAHHLRSPRPGGGHDHRMLHAASCSWGRRWSSTSAPPIRGGLHRIAAHELRPGDAGRRRHPDRGGRLLGAGAGGAQAHRRTGPRWSQRPENLAPPGGSRAPWRPCSSTSMAGAARPRWWSTPRQDGLACEQDPHQATVIGGTLELVATPASSTPPQERRLGA